MKIRMDAVVAAIKDIIESGQEEEFLKTCRERGHFITVNEHLVKSAKTALRRAELSKKQPKGRAAARAAVYARESDTCEA